MTEDSAYNYQASKDFVIENGVVRGNVKPYIDTGHSSYGELILERLRANPEFIGEVDGLTGREVNYAEMMGKSVKCAMWLGEQNIQKGDVIGICTHNQVDMYVPCFASLYLGAIYNPWWDMGITTELTRHFLKITKPKILFIDEVSARMALEVSKEIDATIKIVVFGKISGLQSLDDIIESQSNRVASEFRCTKLSSIDDPAVMVYTSGTTGLPKASLHSNRSIFGNISTYCTGMGKVDGTVRSMTFSSLAWSTGVALMLRGVYRCETRIIYPEFQEEKTLELIEKYKVNWMLSGLSFARRLRRSLSIKERDLSSLKFLWITGAPLKKVTQDELTLAFPGAKIRQGYGSTELGGFAIMQNDDSPFDSCGEIAPNISMKVVDPASGRILGPSEAGEAVFKSPYMMTCYYDNPKATTEIIDPQGWLNSGDIVYYDECGKIYIIDRIKEIIKYRGYQVSPTMIEQILQQHPDIAEAAVLGVPHEIDNEHPIAFVIKAPNAKVTKEELENLVAVTSPDSMRLRGGVKFVDEILYTPSGKVARNELRKLLLKLANS